MDKHTVLNAMGEVDVTASVAAYEASLVKWVQENEIPSDSISTAVNAVLDRFPTKRVSINMLSGLAFAEMALDPALHRSVTQRIEGYIRGQVKTGALESVKGKGGGIGRVKSA